MQPTQEPAQQTSDLMPTYVSPTQHAIEANNYSPEKQEWMNEKTKTNPHLTETQLSHYYDQYILLPKLVGAHTQGSEIQIPTHEETKKTNPDEDPSKLQALWKGYKRGIMDTAQGVKQIMLQNSEPFNRLNAQAFANLPPVIKNMLIQQDTTPQAYTEQVNKQINDYENDDDVSNHGIIAGFGRLMGNLTTGIGLGELRLPRLAEEGVTRLETALSSDTATLAQKVSKIQPSLSRQIAENAMQGSVIGGTMFDPTEQNREVNAAIGGIIGTSSPFVYRGATNFLSWLTKPKMNLIKNPEMINGAIERMQKVSDIGLDRMTAGALTRDPEIQAKEEDLLKAGLGKAAQQFRNIHNDIVSKVYTIGQDMVQKIGGKEVAANLLGEDIQTGLRDARKRLMGKVSDLYEKAAQAPGANTFLAKNDIVAARDSLLDDYVGSQFSNSVNKFVDELKNPQTGFTVKDANKLIKLLNVGYEKQSVINKAVTSVLKNKVFDSIDSQANSESNPARELFNLARQSRASVGEVYDQPDIVNSIIRLRGRVTNYINPENIVKRIFSADALTNLSKVEKALKFEGGEDGKALWDNLRTTKLAQILHDSSVNVNGMMQLSYGKLTNTIKKVTWPVIEKVIDDKEIFKKFKDMVDVMEMYENKAPGTINYSNTANVIKKMAGGLLGTVNLIPGLGYVTAIVKGMAENINNEKWIVDNLKISEMIKSGKIQKIIKENPVTDGRSTKSILENAAFIKKLPFIGITDFMTRPAGTPKDIFAGTPYE